MKLPHDFQEQMTRSLGPAEYALLAEALSQPAPTSIRINGQKIETEQLDLLRRATPVPWCPTGFYLTERPQFTFDPLFHAGCYYVQEASSMFLSHLLRQHVHQPVVALDLCAAPGGKSTLALAQLPEGSVLVANEVVHTRAHILAENITKWGSPHCIVTNNEASDFQPLGPLFDLIICDAPCSGEGMFRKDPASVGEWSLANVETCWRRQRDIAADIWPTLKEGGLFIYSTCTYNPKEDEDTVAWIASQLGAEVLSCHPQAEWGLTERDTHFYPHRTQGEGFFVSILRKTAPADSSPASPRHKKGKNDRHHPKAAQLPDELRAWLQTPEAFSYHEADGTFIAIPTVHQPLYAQAQASLKVIHAGIGLATTKGNALQPSHSLAMSTHLNPGAFPQADISREQAIAYLRTEAIQLPSSAPRGFVLLTHQGHPLGFVKNIGNRANNLYPAEWRIRSGHAK